MRALFIALLALSGASFVTAQPLAVAVEPSAWSVADLGLHIEGGPSMSPAEAILVSVGATAALVVVGTLADDETATPILVLSGLGLGPSLGNALQGEWTHVWIGSAIRTGGSLLMLAGFVDGDVGLFYPGMGALLAGSVYDIVTAGVNARRTRLSRAASLARR